MPNMHGPGNITKWDFQYVQIDVKYAAKLNLACAFLFLYFHPQTLEILVYIHAVLAPSIANTMKLFMKVKNKIGVRAEIYLSFLSWKRNTFSHELYSSPLFEFDFM